MAVKTLDEVLGSLSADEKKLLENTLKNNPELKEGWLRQDDYSRKSNELKAKQAEYDEALEYSERMRAWADVNVPKWDALAEKGIIDKDTGEELWTSKQAELERQLSEARAQAVGGDMDPEVLKANVQAIVKEYGVLSPAEMKAVIAAEASKLAGDTFDTKYAEKETHFNEKTIPFVAGFSSGVAVAAARYERETGKPWTADTAKEFFAMMEKEKNFDPYAVSETFLAPVKKEKDNQAAIDEAVRVALENDRKSRGGMPGGGNEPYIPQSPEKGNLQKMLDRSAGDDFESVIMAGAVAAAKELQAEGKS